MSRVVVLDTSPLGLLSHPAASGEANLCNVWLEGLLAAGTRVILPEVADYEVRRELIRAGKTRGLARLDALADVLEYLPITTAAMHRAAEFWADARRRGRPTADPHALDGDAILAAQAVTLGTEVVVATSNAAHVGLFVAAAEWATIA